MNKIRTFCENIWKGAATYPVAAAVCVLIALLLFYFVFSSIGERLAYSRAKREYNAKTAEIQKQIQTALIEAEKAKARSIIAEEKANKIIQANNERANGQIKKDSELENRIVQTTKEGEKKQNEIESKFNNDILRASNMSDNERAENVCSRIKRLAETNPAFAGYGCTNANTNTGN